VPPVTTPEPAASVVVPSHRGAHRLPDLMAALAAQVVDQPWEVVVVLDGLLDDSEQVLERWRDRLDLVVLANAQPRGTVAALTDGYAAARGRVLIRCDDDLSPGPDMVARHLAHHASREDLGVVGATRDVFPDSPYARAYGRPANERALAAAYARDPRYRWLSWAAHNSLTRTTWDRSGGFDPQFVYGQDYELGYRLHRLGTEIVLDPRLELDHRGPALDVATRAPRAFVSGASRRLADHVHPDLVRPQDRPTGWRARTWTTLVTALSRVVRRRGGYAWLGRRVDALLPHVPPRLGGRLVAFLVEASGASGARYGGLDLRRFKNQKAAELDREVGDDRHRSP